MEEEIIIKCSSEEMIRSFFKDYMIIWHDPALSSQENKKYMADLEKFCKIAAFTEWKEASAYIQRTEAICHVMTSGSNGEYLVKEISQRQNVTAIYIFCRNKDDHSTWAKKYQKISCVENEIGSVVYRIQENLLRWYEQKSSLKLDLPAFAPIFNNKDKSEINNLHRFLKVIPNVKNREQAKIDFVALSKGIYSDENERKNIQDFEKEYTEYNKKAALKWYTRQSFLYKVINNCLRIATSDSIQYSRLLLNDIEKAIKDQYQAKSKEFCGLLYRGSYLSGEEWESLKENRGGEIEMHGFLSTSKKKSIALRFMGVDPKEKVLITIIVPKGRNEEEQGFAEIKEFSQFAGEEEILFNVRSRFTVLETEDEYSEEFSYRHLVLLYGAQGFRRYIAEKNSAKEVSISKTEKITCTCCDIAARKTHEKMMFMSLDQEIFLCNSCLIKNNVSIPLLCVPISDNKKYKANIKGCELETNLVQKDLPMYGYSCANCPTKKQGMYYICTICGKKEKRWCENCLEKAGNCLKEGHAVILETTAFRFWCEKMTADELNYLKFQNALISKEEDDFQQGEMYFRAHEYDKAIKYYMTYNQKNENNSKRSKLTTSYNKIGQIYYKKGCYNDALAFTSKSQKLKQSIKGNLSDNDTVFSYRIIGKIHGMRRDYEKAREYHWKSLKIKESRKERDDLDIALTYNDIGHMYDRQGKFEDGLKYYSKAFKIRRRILGDAHPTVAHSLFHMGLQESRKGDEEEAIEYFSKALQIRESAYGTNHPQVASCLYEMGIAYYNQNEYEKALKSQLKALEIRKNIYKGNHPDIASCYAEIARVYLAEKDYQKALESHSKALEIRNFFRLENPSDLVISQNFAKKIEKKMRNNNKK